MAGAYHGVDGLIYVSGTEIAGANAWNISITPSIAEGGEFGDDWAENNAGLLSWSGSITCQDHKDISVLFDTCVTAAAHALLIYPDKGTLANYYCGNAIFGWGSDGDHGSNIGKSADFTGDGELTQAGFA